MKKRKWWATGLAIALAVVLLAPLASRAPDGLERVAEDKGFQEKAQDASVNIIADYLFPGIENEAIATVLAGVVGVLVVFVLVTGVGLLLKRRDRSSHPTTKGASR